MKRSPLFLALSGLSSSTMERGFHESGHDGQSPPSGVTSRRNSRKPERSFKGLPPSSFEGALQVIRKSCPVWMTLSSRTAAGTRASGGMRAPFFPQPEIAVAPSKTIVRTILDILFIIVPERFEVRGARNLSFAFLDPHFLFICRISPAQSPL